nr:spore development regulator vosa [Quercus suber]
MDAYTHVGRKPVDPPPIVQMNVKPHVDPNSPHVFMCASPLQGAEGEEQVPQEKVVGQQVSSLHRLKDINDEDGGFFVFGDISLRGTGTHRLRFDLYNLERFRVLTLSRGVKRSWQSPDDQPATQRQGSAYNSSSVSNYAYSGTGSIKRARPGSNHSNTSQFPQFQVSTTGPPYGGSTIGSSPAWSDQNQHNYMAVQTSASGSYLPLQAYNMGGTPVQWQRGMQPGSLTTQNTGSTQMSYLNNRRGSGHLGSPYLPQQPSQYLASGRTQTQPSGNAFSDLSDFHSSSQLPEAGQGNNYLQSNSEYSGQLNSAGSGGLAAEQTYLHQGVHSTPISKWTPDTGRSVSTIPAVNLFASSQPPDSGISGFQYDAMPQTPTSQYSRSQQTITHAPYSGIPRAAQQHPHNSNAMANATLSGITGNLFATSSEPDWSGYSPHEGAGSQQLTDQALAQHQNQQGFNTTQHPWTR